MKKIKKTKLALGTETIRDLGTVEMKQVVGGVSYTCLDTHCFCLPTYVPSCEPSFDGNCLPTWNCAPSHLRGCV